VSSEAPRPAKPNIIFAPRVDSLREVQNVQDQFAFHGVPEQTPDRVMNHIGNEMAELQEAVAAGDVKEIGGEMADIFLLLNRLASIHHIDLGQAISAKMRRNADKYSPYRLGELINDGLDEESALQKLKGQWDRSDDQRYR
jgi:NTP pyrophosphatase (non-canonical NTP hydrolase)